MAKVGRIAIVYYGKAFFLNIIIQFLDKMLYKNSVVQAPPPPDAPHGLICLINEFIFNQNHPNLSLLMRMNSIFKLLSSGLPRTGGAG